MQTVLYNTVNLFKMATLKKTTNWLSRHIIAERRSKALQDILQCFRPSLSYHLLLRSVIWLFLSDRFAQVLLCSFIAFSGKETFSKCHLLQVVGLSLTFSPGQILCIFKRVYFIFSCASIDVNKSSNKLRSHLRSNFNEFYIFNYPIETRYTKYANTGNIKTKLGFLAWNASLAIANSADPDQTCSTRHATDEEHPTITIAHI